MQQETCYVACNCNQTPSAVHWGKNNLVCYTACNSVRIYDPKCGSGGKVVATLVGHTQRVNSVRWLVGVGHETELVSGSSDHTAIVWSLKMKTYVPHVLKGHEGNVNLVDGLYKDTGVIIVSVGIDSSVKLWSRERPTDDFVLFQNINCGDSICVGLRISSLPTTNILILACAMDNSKIELYTEDNQFTLSTTLKGHEDWVRGLDFTIDDKGDLILASCSQDCYIRLWRITTSLQVNSDNVFKMKGITYGVYIDSILTGHEGWIYSVNWNPKGPQLLSASLDKSMVIWEVDPESNLWVEKVRVGEVGGNTLGFYGGIFGPNGDSILAHSYHGAFHAWNYNNDSWEPSVTVGGHFREVTDLAWEPQGEYIITVSADQTTRIHAPWSKFEESVTWHEIARPQVHGYDLSSGTILSRYKFASSAEEKVIRTFQAPQDFVENFARICKIKDIGNSDENVPRGASVPSLGLSNKGVFTCGANYEEESHFSPIILTGPPTEETLLQNTLWPEVQKLYGHGYEVYCLASSPDGRFLASACKATTPEHAAILIWDTSSWQQVQKLISHTLTVAQMAFSPDSEHLLSVSRDRRWSLFSKNAQNHLELVATTDKKTSVHKRIIWCCGWSHDSKYFVTGSRDGKAVVWTKNENKKREGVLGPYEAIPNYLDLKNESLTAVAFAPDIVLGSYLIAVGFESGVIQCYKWSTHGWESVLLLDKPEAHHLAVKRLAFRPMFGKAGYKNDEKNVLQLASCGDDYAVIVHNILIK